MPYYLDTSAAAKLVMAEAESPAMASWAASHEGRVVSSDLLRTELLRATRRSAPSRMRRARSVLEAVVVMGLPPTVFEHAATLAPDELRSLDALHLAAALRLGDELEGIVTYDDRMTAAAEGLGLAVIAPR